MDPLVPTQTSDHPPRRWGTALLQLLAGLAFVLWVFPFFTASKTSLGTYWWMVGAMMVLSGMGFVVGLLVTSRRREEIASGAALRFVPATVLCLVILVHSVMATLEGVRATSYVATVIRMRDVGKALAAYHDKHGKYPATLDEVKDAEDVTRPWVSPSTGKRFEFDLNKAAETKTLVLDEGDDKYRSYWFRPLLPTGFQPQGEIVLSGGDLAKVKAASPEQEVSLLLHAYYGQERSGPITVNFGSE